MKIASKQFAQNIKTGSAEELPKVSLIFGDDSGLVKSLANQLVQRVSNGDELAVERISAHSIIDQPSALFDSAFAVSMFSDLKVIIIDDFIDLGQKIKKLNETLTELLDMQHQLDKTYIVIPALGIEASSSLVKKYEKDTDAGCVRCFVDSNFDLKKVIFEFFNEKHKSVDTKALIYLQNSLGNDRMITLQELDKLDLYTDGKTDISLQDCLDCIVSADSVNLYKFCDSIGLKDKNSAQKYLFLLTEEGYDYALVLISVVRHLKRLLIVKSASEKNSTPVTAEMGKLRPPVFFGKDEFSQQVDNFELNDLQQAVFGFMDLQVKTRLNPQTAKSMIEEFIFNL
ncbi:MAG TPA: DNA polymerase III subunit delta [Alphaproteobacteria bacterium]|nr:DNA polymerase III subunit delta [Alphaproteobacteria bacterium]